MSHLSFGRNGTYSAIPDGIITPAKIDPDGGVWQFGKTTLLPTDPTDVFLNDWHYRADNKDNLVISDMKPPITTGSYNTLIGVAAGMSLTTGYENIFIGESAGWGATGHFNIGIGNVATQVAEGTDNIGIGQSATGVTIGDNNTGVGLASLWVIANGSSNTAIGSYSGRDFRNGSYNLFVGDHTGDHASQATTISGSVAIGTDSSGNGAYTTLDNQFVLGTANHNIYVPGKVGIGVVGPSLKMEVSSTAAGVAKFSSTNTNIHTAGPLVEINSADTSVTTEYHNLLRLKYSAVTGGTFTLGLFSTFEDSAGVIGDIRSIGAGKIGLYGSSQISLGSATTERLRIDSNGDVSVLTGDFTITRSPSTTGTQHMRLGMWGVLQDKQTSASTSSSGSYQTLLMRNAYITNQSTNTYDQLNTWGTKGMVALTDSGLSYKYRAGAGGAGDTWDDAGWTGLLSITSTTSVFAGKVGIGVTPAARLQLSTVSHSTIGFLVSGVAGQTANLSEWRDSSSTILAKIDAAGNLTATTKSFDIEHPTKTDMRLHHGSLEGPEHAVYIRGRASGDAIVFPDYWAGLVDSDTITVQLTGIGHNDVYVESLLEDKVLVAAGGEYFYFIQATRKDIDPLVVEYEHSL